MPRTSAVRFLAPLGLALASAALVTSSPPVTAQSATGSAPVPQSRPDRRRARRRPRRPHDPRGEGRPAADARTPAARTSRSSTRGSPARSCTSSARRSTARWTSRRRTASASRCSIGEDGIHGHSFWKGATIFPTQLAMAASWNPELLEQVGRVTAEEMAPTGIHETFSPVLCLTRDLRWGRTGETFGEDPYLIGELGAALIRGYQGKGLDDPTAVARHRQALRRLLRDAGRPRRLRGRHLAAQAAQLLPAAVRARRPRRRHDVHDRLPVDGRRALDRQPLAAHATSSRTSGASRACW